MPTCESEFLNLLQSASMCFCVQCRDVRTREVGIQEIHHKVRPYQVTRSPKESRSNAARLQYDRKAVRFIKRSSVSSGGAGAEGLRGQRGLGDLPLLRGPGAGHPDRPAASAPLLAPVLPTRAQGRRLHRPRAPRLRQRRPRQQPRPQQVPAPGGPSGHDRRPFLGHIRLFVKP